MRVLPRQNLACTVKGLLYEYAYNIDGVSQLDWKVLDARAKSLDVNKFLEPLDDPYTGFVLNEQWQEEARIARTSALRQGNFARIGYIRIAHFMSSRLAVCLQECLQNNNWPAMIIDLRDNPGGAVEEALSCASLLLPPQSKLEQRHMREEGNFVFVTYTGSGNTAFGARLRKGRESPCRAKRRGLLKNMVVLINGETASAAEVLAGALHAHGATTVGGRSWGKSIIQRTFSIRQKQLLRLRITVGKNFTPTGFWSGDGFKNKYGLTPDYVVHQQASKVSLSEDEQLQFAIQLLR